MRYSRKQQDIADGLIIPPNGGKETFFRLQTAAALNSRSFTEPARGGTLRKAPRLLGIPTVVLDDRSVSFHLAAFFGPTSVSIAFTRFNVSSSFVMASESSVPTGSF